MECVGLLKLLDISVLFLFYFTKNMLQMDVPKTMLVYSEAGIPIVLKTNVSSETNHECVDMCSPSKCVTSICPHHAIILRTYSIRTSSKIARKVEQSNSSSKSSTTGAIRSHSRMTGKFSIGSGITGVTSASHASSCGCTGTSNVSSGFS